LFFLLRVLGGERIEKGKWKRENNQCPSAAICGNPFFLPQISQIPFTTKTPRHKEEHEFYLVFHRFSGSG
jgi:hypothetical protein